MLEVSVMNVNSGSGRERFEEVRDDGIEYSRIFEHRPNDCCASNAAPAAAPKRQRTPVPPALALRVGLVQRSRSSH
jgi:hypothetical protein